MSGLSRSGSIWGLGSGMNPFSSTKAPIKKELKNIIDEVVTSIILFFTTTIIMDSCFVIIMIMIKSDHR